MPYQPIEDYGVIGDMHSAALVCRNGSIDWLCLPHFNSPSVFASILDDKKGGHFSISTVNETVSNKQFYWPDTNILLTRLFTKDGVGEIVDFMPIHNIHGGHGRHQLVRIAKSLRGINRFRLECMPAFNYARDQHDARSMEHGACFHSKSMNLALSARIPLKIENRGAVCEFELKEGETATFVLYEMEKVAACSAGLNEKETNELFRRTVNYWRNWIGKSTYTGRWREIVHRSALALKLLTYEPTGAIVAAPTAGLPEGIGGERNWDYRYSWIRDAAFTVYGLLRIGFSEEALKFMEWIESRAKESNPDGSIQLMYGIDGEHELKEEILDHLEGYKGSKPVRIGNAAYNQLQLDIYGELMDSVYLYNKYGSPISYDLWSHLRKMTNWVVKNWQKKDEGVWEVRGGKRHFVYSKLMCWVALDRAIRLAEKRSFPADRDKWSKVRDDIYLEIMDKVH